MKRLPGAWHEAAVRPREAQLRREATRLFRERGFHATSMQDLAEALGMNRGSLYHYIESKDDLLWWIVSGTLDQAVTDAARDAVQEILRRGADTGIFFAGSKKGVTVSAVLTTQDREFLRAVSIKPDR